MRKSVFILSLTTVAFAASTAWLARELYLRDTSDALIAATPADSMATRDIAPRSIAGAEKTGEAAGMSTRTTISPAADTARPAGVAAPADSTPRDAQADAVAGFARQFLARYDDSNQRPVLLDEQRTVIRRQYAKLKEQLKLSDSTFEQLVTLLAEEQLQMQEHWARCAVAKDCDPRNQRNLNIDHSQEYQAMLGLDGAEAFTRFRGTIGERDAVIQLRGRLADSNFLPEAQAEKLIAALSEERTRFSEEITARGAKMVGWGTQLGMLWYTEDSGLPEQYIAEATQYSQRLRNRAASILTPAQLAAYAQMQEELLAQFTSNQRPPPRQNKTSLARTS